jgi:exopolysaccharide biosynthesis polyprenyl glycosylphosphotransferase
VTVLNVTTRGGSVVSTTAPPAASGLLPQVRTGHSLRLVPLVAVGLDAGVALGAGMLAVLGRTSIGVEDPDVISASLMVSGPLMLVGLIVAIAVLGGYRRDVFVAGADEFKRVFNAGLLTAGLVGVGCYLTKFELSRGFFLLAIVLGIPALLLGRTVLRQLLHRAHRHGVLRQQVVLVGPTRQVDEIGRVLGRESWLGYDVTGAFVPGAGGLGETSSGIPVLGDIDHALERAVEAGADVLVIAGSGMADGDAMRQFVWQAEGQSIQVVVAPSVSEISGERIKVRPVGGLPLMHIDPPTWTDAARWGKRAFDIVGSMAALLVFSPVIVVAALSVKLHDRGPVFFGHTRIGRRGEPFRCLKFRTMVPDAESLVARMQAERGESALLWKDRNDPRITRPGRWLRRFSVDELPQLFNVLAGHMSLVGPRPQVSREVELYDGSMARRLHVRPGMTGLWQVSGRNDLSPEEAIRLDLYYVDNWSMVQDLLILARTVGAVFSSRGAY